MGEFREIITKAVVAKGRKFTQSNHKITPKHHPSSILGCWIINHHYEAKKSGKKVEVCGYYDINVWYSYNDNTQTEVATERVKYEDTIRLKYRDPDCLDDIDVIAKVLQQPNCVEAVISPDGKRIVVQVEREFLVEVIGETTICIEVHKGRHRMDDDDWGFGEEDDVDDEEFEDIDPDFLQKDHKNN